MKHGLGLRGVISRSYRVFHNFHEYRSGTSTLLLLLLLLIAVQHNTISEEMEMMN